jgi:hypothetical protein
VSASQFIAGETLTVGLEARNPAGNPAADLYVGVLVPDGQGILLFVSRTSLVGPLPRSQPSTFPRFAEAPPGFVLDEPVFFRITFGGTGGVPPGPYIFVAAFMRPNGLADDRIDPSDLVALSTAGFNFLPAPATPAYSPLFPLMFQVVAVGPVFVTSQSAVAPEALYEAGSTLAAMLRHRPDVADRLRAGGAFTTVFAHAGTVCELPYYTGPPLATCLQNSGGLGGTTFRPVTACNDAALLRTPFDVFGRGTRPDGENTCVHQLAHTVMNVGFTDDERTRIGLRFLEARSTPLWEGHFATTSPSEFFAEMSQIYFCANPAIPTFFHPQAVNCAEALRQYDPATHALLESLYGSPTDLR